MKRFVLVVALVACGKTESTPATTTAPAGSSTAAIAESIRVKICTAEPCGGDMSSITVYRDASGAVKKLYRLYGRCSHNAAMYFDPDGTNTETIAEEPIEPGSEKEKQIDAKHQAQVGGLKADEKTISCRGVK